MDLISVMYLIMFNCIQFYYNIMTTQVKPGLYSELIFRTIKIIDIGYITVLFFIVGYF